MKNSNNYADHSLSLNDYINDNRPIITAHRGYAEKTPENTMAAFAAAVALGAEAIEFDVHRSGDGTLVVIHDETVDRTTNGTGQVAELSDEYLKSLDAGSWKGDEFTGENIPTLKETLAYLKKNSAAALLEIKTSSIVADVVRMLFVTGMEKRTLIITFEKSAVIEIKAKHPEIPALLLLDSAFMTGTVEEKIIRILKEAEEVGTKDIGPFAFDWDLLKEDLGAIDKINNSQDPGEQMLWLDSDTIRVLQENGYRIDAWTVDSEENIRSLIKSKVDILTTNFLERALKIKREVLKK